ncbi:MAG TPA: polysaccharide deacetylase family protein [Methanomassiliicoccales archaeon]|nr:polysaccharide deacetylase family protein [Methanomassiliicoccales archaeon]
MRAAVFTVDVDRDVNVAEEGRYDAASSSATSEPAPRFSSAGKGLSIIAEVLDSLDIPATFFFEGDTLRALSKQIDLGTLLAGHEVACHGVCHEDLTGESTGICLTGPEISEVVSESASIVQDIMGRKPVGFRAPYLHVNDESLRILSDEGFLYDSSKTRSIVQGRIGPYRLEQEIWELPVAEGKDASGRKIVSYLWPMHEGKRSPSDYEHMASSLKQGCLVLATHSWHLVETYDRGVLSDTDREENVGNLMRALQLIKEQGLKFITAKEAVESVAGGRYV